MNTIPNTQSASALYEDFGILPNNLGQELRARLAERLENDKEFSREEIERVSSKSARICSEQFALQKDDYEKIRVLCILSQCGMNDALKISSHRKFIGPCIVAAKRVFWRIIRSQLDNTFNGIQEFSSWMLYSHIKLLERVQELEKSDQ